MIAIFFLSLTFASWIYWLVAAALTRAFFKRHSSMDANFKPALSILKPVKGVDAEAFENYASFCQQNYPCYEILFGVADQHDPAVAVIECIQAQFPNRSIRLLVGEQYGANQKVSLLHTLASEARYPYLVISDSDMRVTPDYLQRVIAPLADEGVGLVTCPYRGALPTTLTARLEALYMGVTFLPSVIVGRKFLRMRFAMGSTLALRQHDLRRIGGFRAIADYLADDYQIGSRIAGLGLKVVLSGYVVTSVLGETSFREQWQREVRWSHCTRISRPLEYPGLALSFATPLALGYLVSSGFSVLGWLSLAVSVAERYIVGWVVSESTHDRVSQKWLFWLPVRDMLSALIWLAGLVGRRVVWRGVTFRVNSDGTLQSVRQQNLPSIKDLPGRLFGQLVPQIDWVLRRYHGVFEFDQDERCILRLSRKTCERDTTLANGEMIRQGELIGELHFWNEHIPAITEKGADLAWARAFQSKAVYSLSTLAEFASTEPDFSQVQAFLGTSPFGGRFGGSQMDDFLRRWGFEIMEKSPPKRTGDRFAQFWDSFYAWGLMLAFNPGSLQGKRLTELHRSEWWMTRNTLLDCYLDRQQTADQAQDHQAATLPHNQALADEMNLETSKR